VVALGAQSASSPTQVAEVDVTVMASLPPADFTSAIKPIERAAGVAGGARSQASNPWRMILSIAKNMVTLVTRNWVDYQVR
jgi:hypothetical protein